MLALLITYIMIWKLDGALPSRVGLPTLRWEISGDLEGRQSLGRERTLAGYYAVEPTYQSYQLLAGNWSLSSADKLQYRISRP